MSDDDQRLSAEEHLQSLDQETLNRWILEIEYFRGSLRRRFGDAISSIGPSRQFLTSAEDLLMHAIGAVLGGERRVPDAPMTRREFKNYLIYDVIKSLTWHLARRAQQDHLTAVDSGGDHGSPIENLVGKGSYGSIPLMELRSDLERILEDHSSTRLPIVCKLLFDGFSKSEIARHFGCANSTITADLKKLWGLLRDYDIR